VGRSRNEVAASLATRMRGFDVAGGVRYRQCIDIMKAILQKWGNSLALRIPKTFADEIKVHEGHPVDVCVAKGRIVVAPITARNYRLDDLVAAITRKNRHGEIVTGDAQGREVW
jgi:antitoxin MazE